MPPDYLELVRASYAALERGDVDYLLDHSDPDIEVAEPPDLPGSRTYRGYDGLVEAIQNWVGESDEFHVDVERLIDAGNARVITLVRHHGRGKSVHLHTGRDGKIIRWEMFGALDDAFAAIGLRKLKGES
jgi:ketosteroid isomerase-like protein